MFVTDSSWREHSPVKQSMVQPFEAWRVIGIVPVVPIFRVQLGWSRLDDDCFVRSFLVASVESLLQVVDDLSPEQRHGIQVHLVEDASLERVCELWGTCVDGGKPPTFGYRNAKGEMHACVRGFPVSTAARCLAVFSA